MGVPGGVDLAELFPLPPPIESDLAAVGLEPPIERETAFASPDGGGSVILLAEGWGAGAGSSSQEAGGGASWLRCRS